MQWRQYEELSEKEKLNVLAHEEGHMLHLHEEMRKHGELYKGFHADVEYNRNRNTIKKIFQKKEDNDDGIIVNINCDLLVHGRGLTLEQEKQIVTK